MTVNVDDATIGTGVEDSKTFTLNITDVNEPPSITSNGSGPAASINVVENSTAVTTVTASDPDAGANQTYSIIGGTDQAFFTINSVTGALAFRQRGLEAVAEPAE